MNKPRKNSERKRTSAKRSNGKATGDRGKHPFKKFMGTKGPGALSNKAAKNRSDKKSDAGRVSEISRRHDSVEAKNSNQQSGRAPSGRRFFKKDEESIGSKREGNKPFAVRKNRNQSESKRERPDKYEKGRRDSGLKEKRFNRDEFVSGEGFVKQISRSSSKVTQKARAKTNASNDGLIRLNKYLSNAGIASRRDADTLIISGAVKVNGIVVNQLGAKIRPGDKVTYGDQAVKGERKVYLLLNKPKDYITTMEDERDRKTVMKLVEGACRERIYPVGRLDRNTTGLLLMTNDGELTTKLTHPKHGIKKVYHVSLNKSLKPEHFKEIMDGLELEDGMVKVDDLAFVGEGKKEVGVEIHSGKNRVVRRLFEHLGYDVIKLDRVVFAGLTKKDLPRGKFRFLTAKEISFLQMIG